MQRHKKEYHPKDPLALTPNLDWVEEVEKEEEQRQIGLKILWSSLSFCINKDWNKFKKNISELVVHDQAAPVLYVV